MAQKNTSELGGEVSLKVIGFDFAAVEEYGADDECDRFADVFGDAIVAIEYTDDGFATARSSIEDRSSVVRRDLFGAVPGSSDYVDGEC